MNTAAIEESVQVTCSHCRQRFRIRSSASLKPGAKSTCATCGTRFHVVAVSRPSDARSEPATDSPPFMDGANDRQTTAAQPQLRLVHTARFFGAGGSLFGIHLVNVCLTLLTLTIYSFWAKVRVRHYLYSQTQFAGDRFAYHGTGRELLNGATKATFVFALPYLAVSNASMVLGGGLLVSTTTQILSALLVLTFLPVAITGARRYRLSHSSWRGIRFSFRGKAVSFMKIYIQGAILTGVTLGAYYPVFEIKRHAYLVDHSFVGNRAFSFDGEGWGLATSFVRAAVLLPFTIGLSWFWYMAARQRYIWNHTSLGPARFSCTVQGWPLLMLKAGNLLLLIVSLGLAWPWTAVRNARFIMDNLSLKGHVDFDRIVQDAQASTTTGEGLSSFLDSGFDLG